LSNVSDLEKSIWNLLPTIGEKLSSRSRSEIPYPNKSTLALQVFQDFESEESWKEFCKHPDVTNHLGKAVSTESLAPVTLTEASIGVGLVMELLGRAVDSADFVKRLSAFFQNETVTLVTRGPVYWLTIEAPYPIELEQGIELHLPPLTDQFAFSTPFEIDIRPSFVLEHKWSEKKTLREPSQVVHPTGLISSEPSGITTRRRFVYTLLLLGKYKFRVPYGETKVDAPGINIGYKSLFHPPLWMPESSSGVDHLRVKDLEQLKGAWKDMSMLSSPQFLAKTGWLGWLATALDRMEIAHERDNFRDALIDCCTSLETLLTHEETSGLTYRFKQRGAFLFSLGQESISNEEVEKVREFLKKAYEMRSKLVHGDDEYEAKAVKETFEKLTELCRIFCLKLVALANGRKHKALIQEDLDLAMAFAHKAKELEEKLRKSTLSKYWI
jgi:hypothetical protein